MKDLIRFFRNQEMLKSSGYYPYGWYKGKLIWSKDQKGSVTRVLENVEEDRIIEIDEINTLLLG